jgi:hypothetical protein
MTSKLSTFLSELKRRKVYRVAVVYVVAGAGIWAGAEVAFPALNLADPEEWRNLAGDPAYRGVRNRLAGHMPSDPAPVAETSYQLAPHHVPPLKSKEEYLPQRGLG